MLIYQGFLFTSMTACIKRDIQDMHV